MARFAFGGVHYPTEDNARNTVYVRVSKRAYPRDPYAHAVSLGVAPARLSCQCSHCARGYDCCGRLFPCRATVRRTRRGYAVTVHYTRNV